MAKKLFVVTARVRTQKGPEAAIVCADDEVSVRTKTI